MIRALHYARWREGRQDLEVNLVAVDDLSQKPSLAFEVKGSDRAPQTLGDLRGLHTLALKHPLTRNPLVTTRTYTRRAEIDGMAIDFMPVGLYCYVIARQVLAS